MSTERVGFITAAGPGIGLGHLRRCSALASALSARGVIPRLIVDGRVDASGTVDLASIPWIREPALAVEALEQWKAGAVIVDAYDADETLFAALRLKIGLVVAIDDLADRRLPVDVVVNGSVAAGASAYRVLPDTTLLLGSRYALLDPAFAAPPPARPVAARVQRALITLGGDAPAEALEAAVRALRTAAPLAAIDLVVGPFTRAGDGDDAGVTTHRGLTSLRALMITADLAVCGGGMTLSECLATGTPTVAICLASNQRPNINALRAAGAIVVGDDGLEAAVRQVAESPTLRETLAARGRALVDGAGANRVASAVHDAMRSSLRGKR
jgi:UDP-2,4-diacetamido-2,4,6-trideoxy-beta-L-altropyranose hydrolase